MTPALGRITTLSVLAGLAGSCGGKVLAEPGSEEAGAPDGAASCGAQDESCCNGTDCSTGLTCSGLTCTAVADAQLGSDGGVRDATASCGGLGESCCHGTHCNAELTCGGGTCNDTTDGSGGDADGPAVPPGLIQYGTDQATAMCTRFLSCCPGGPSGYDLNQCVAMLLPVGWEGSLGGQPFFFRGYVGFDPAAAAGCIAAINGMPCTPPGQTPAEWKAITATCFSVLKGVIPVGQGGCLSPFECQPNAYCDSTVDGGALDGGLTTGVCAALATTGQACNTKSPADTMCSYAGSGTPSLFCDLINGSADAATCQPQLADGQNCVNPSTFYYDDQACMSGLCGDNFQCGGTTSYPYPPFCSSLLLDGGGG